MSQSCLKEENLIHIQNWTTFNCHHGIFINLLLFFFGKNARSTNGDRSSPILTLFSTLLKASGLKRHPVQDALYQWNCKWDPRHIIFAYKMLVSVYCKLFLPSTSLFPLISAQGYFGIIDPFPENIYPIEGNSAQVTCVLFNFYMM